MFITPPASKLGGYFSYTVFPSLSFFIPAAIAEHPVSTTMYFLLANSSVISAISLISSGKLEQPTMAIIPGMVPSTRGAPTFRISVSMTGPRPALTFHDSFPATACIMLIMGTLRGHSCSHLPHPRHFSNTSVSSVRSPFFAASTASPTGKRLGQTWLHILHSLWSFAISGTCSAVTCTLFLLGASSSAALTATSAALSGSNINACSPWSTISLTISSTPFLFLSSSP